MMQAGSSSGFQLASVTNLANYKMSAQEESGVSRVFWGLRCIVGRGGPGMYHDRILCSARCRC